jgi:hypothetical protein
MTVSHTEQSEVAALRGTIDYIMEAIKGDRFSDGLQSADDYVRYSLGTAGCLYHVDGYMEMFESRARWIRAFNRLEKAVTNHIDNCIDADDLAHVHRAVMRDLGPVASTEEERDA